MEEPTEFQDWELLHCSDAGVPASASATADPFEGGNESDSDGPFKSDYFALDSDKRYARRGTASDDDSLADSDNPSWVDPNSDSRYVGGPRGGLGFAGVGFPRGDPCGFWPSDESSDGQKSPPPAADHVERGARCREGPKLGEGTGGEKENEEVGLGGIGGTSEVEAGSENSDELGTGDTVPEVSEERTAGNMENISVSKGEKVGTAWWKLPFELLNFCVLRVRPVWSISIAAVVVGIVMLGRRLYKMKRKSRSLPLKISMDDKKVSQFTVRVARLNEAFSVVKRVPIIKSSLPAATGVTPWPVMMALR